MILYSCFMCAVTLYIMFISNMLRYHIIEMAPKLQTQQPIKTLQAHPPLELSRRIHQSLERHQEEIKLILRRMTL